MAKIFLKILILGLISKTALSSVIDAEDLSSDVSKVKVDEEDPYRMKEFYEAANEKKLTVPKMIKMIERKSDRREKIHVLGASKGFEMYKVCAWGLNGSYLPAGCTLENPDQFRALINRSPVARTESTRNFQTGIDNYIFERNNGKFTYKSKEPEVVVAVEPVVSVIAVEPVMPVIAITPAPIETTTARSFMSQFPEMDVSRASVNRRGFVPYNQYVFSHDFRQIQPRFENRNHQIMRFQPDPRTRYSSEMLRKLSYRPLSSYISKPFNNDKPETLGLSDELKRKIKKYVTSNENKGSYIKKLIRKTPIKKQVINNEYKGPHDKPTYAKPYLEMYEAPAQYIPAKHYYEIYQKPAKYVPAKRYADIYEEPAKYAASKLYADIYEEPAKYAASKPYADIYEEPAKYAASKPYADIYEEPAKYAAAKPYADIYEEPAKYAASKPYADIYEKLAKYAHAKPYADVYEKPAKYANVERYADIYEVPAKYAHAKPYADIYEEPSKYAHAKKYQDIYEKPAKYAYPTTYVDIYEDPANYAHAEPYAGIYAKPAKYSNAKPSNDNYEDPVEYDRPTPYDDAYENTIKYTYTNNPTKYVPSKKYTNIYDGTTKYALAKPYDDSQAIENQTLRPYYKYEESLTGKDDPYNKLFNYNSNVNTEKYEKYFNIEPSDKPAA